MTEFREALLAAHVEFELSRLEGEAFAKLIGEHVGAGFAWLESVTANDVVTRERIVGVIERYVIELPVSGGITELAGEMANVVFSSPASTSTRIEEVCSPESFSEFADKVLGLAGIQQELFRQVTGSAAFGTLASRVIARVIIDALFRRDADASGATPVMPPHGWRQRAAPTFERGIGAVLERYVDKHARNLSRNHGTLLRSADREWVRQMADEIWDGISKRSLSSVATVFSAQDLEDFVVLGYEFWLKFRRTRYFSAVVAEAVDHLFDKYGDESLASLIADMGVTQQMVIDELRILLGPLIDHARDTGFLARELEALLAPFYRSDALTAALASRDR